MFEHWFVVASQKTVKVFGEISNKNKLEQFKVLDNPLGRERIRELIRKLAGISTKSTGVGSVRYTETKRHNPHEEAARQFAKTIAQFLNEEYRLKHFKTLTIVAEPHFLGKIRSAMDPKLKMSVIQWLKKDLQNTPKKTLNRFLLQTTGRILPREMVVTQI